MVNGPAADQTWGPSAFTTTFSPMNNPWQKNAEFATGANCSGQMVTWSEEQESCNICTERTAANLRLGHLENHFDLI